MTDKELRRLSREELLRLLIAQTEENDRLKRQLDEVKGQLNDRRIAIDRAGSIAEASLALSDIFEQAQHAAALYLENIERLSREQEAVCAQAQRQAKTIIDDANAFAQKSKADADTYWRMVVDRTRQSINTEAVNGEDESVL